MGDFYTVRCPFCFKKLKTNNVIFREEVRTTTEDFILKAFNEANGQFHASASAYQSSIDPSRTNKNNFIKDVNNESIIAGIADPSGETGIVYTQKLCPYCHNKLTSSFATEKTKYISVIGLTGSGKTAYLSAANASLNFRDFLWASIDREANKILDDTTREYMNNADIKIATQNIQGPYYYSIRTDEEKEIDTNIVFYDIPGEFYEDVSKLNDTVKKYLLFSDGIIFVINVADDVKNQSIRVNRILTTLYDIGIRKNKKIAIVLNKMDKIAQITPDFIGRYMIKSEDKNISLDRIKTKSEAIKGYLLSNSSHIDSTLKTVIERINNQISSDSCIFASSIINENNDKKEFTYSGSEIPILWLIGLI